MSGDPDMQVAVNALGDALSAAMPGATSAEVRRIMDALCDVLDVRIVQFAELEADHAEKLRASAA